MPGRSPQDRERRVSLHGVDPCEEYLCELRSPLRTLGCPAELVRPEPGALVLRVSYPDRPLDSEDVVCAWTEGEWWFTWIGGHIIGPAEDLGGVAIAIYRTLRDGQVPS
ncbi:hypothetical protein [Thermomonospora echinospora]|nr:hypothetical protein [Thermomonospora echinospora]